MRTTKATIFPFSWRLPQKDRTPPRPAVPGEAEREQRRILWHFLLGSVFVAGYLGGLWAGRTQEPEFGRSLARFYMDSSQYLAYGGVFGSLFSGSFLQLTTVLLMGFSALGVGLLPVFFLAKGAFYGLGAASVYLQGGARGLVVHWLINSLPDLFLLFVLLWFALRAKTMAEDLGRCLQGGSRLRRTMPVGKLLLDYGLALLLAALLSALGAALAVIFAGVLL